jgi:hypothetical protein
MLAESYRMGLFDLTHLSLFYDNNFNTAAKRQQFILKIVKTEPVGDPSITMADIQRAIRAFCIQHVSNKITGTAIRADTIRERRLLRTLLLRHGVPHDLRLPGQTGACTDEGHDRE